MPNRKQDWIEQARRDLENAAYSAKGGFHEWACFAAHQAAEKALKAVFFHLGGEAWGHGVLELLAGLEARTEVPDELKHRGRELDRFYIPTRYPNGWPAGKPADYFTDKDSRDAIGCAERILRFSEGLLARPQGGD